MSSRRSFLRTTLLTGLWANLGFSKSSTDKNAPANSDSSPSCKVSNLQDLFGKWEPQKTWVFAIGVLTYPDGEAWPQAGRSDKVMIDQLQKVGVPKNQIEFISDQNAHIKTVKSNFESFLARAPKGSTLWFYFAGHGAKNNEGTGSFVLYDKQWPIPEVINTIERHFNGQIALLFADCCYSGNLALEAMLRAGRPAYAVLTSSLSSVTSTGEWTFTNCLIQCLKGAVQVDGNIDGHIDFLELAAFTEREMATHDGQLSTFVAANGFDPRMSIRATDKNGVNRDHHTKKQQKALYSPGSKVDIKWQGKWYPGFVITARLGMHLISYDGYSFTWDEWVDASRIKLAKN